MPLKFFHLSRNVEVKYADRLGSKMEPVYPSVLSSMLKVGNRSAIQSFVRLAWFIRECDLSIINSDIYQFSSGELREGRLNLALYEIEAHVCY